LVPVPPPRGHEGQPGEALLCSDAGDADQILGAARKHDGLWQQLVDGVVGRGNHALAITRPEVTLEPAHPQLRQEHGM